ncbi:MULTISPECIES: STAS domain-containing protein [Actinomadura]|uniref:Anti-sigma factor antagonist n=1 Tax=Actinomadura yumaensis TaxID=111807 RepID=A0ABW2CJI1_9ACTN|nr:STAS domain-containing protein [Actinomadura sp. J1-007]MWK37051.1 anti-sigma factor antagonist [Actinomadura sp. J1-007]
MTTAPRRPVPLRAPDPPSASTPEAASPGPAPGVPAHPSPLGIGVLRDGYTTILRLHGELDIATAPDLRRHITLAIEEHDPHRLLLHLSDLAFIDSSGLAVVVWAHQTLDRRGRQLRLHHPSHRVLRILHVTGLHTRLHITETGTGALSPLRRRLAQHRTGGSPPPEPAGPTTPPPVR